MTAAATPAIPSAAPATPKVSWIHHIGNVLGHILGVVAKDGATVVKFAVPLAEVLLPQFTPEIIAAGGIASRILKQIAVTQGAAAAIATANTGPEKMDAVLLATQAEFDGWIQSMFPGAKEISKINKAGFVQAVYNIANEIEAPKSPAAV